VTRELCADLSRARCARAAPSRRPRAVQVFLRALAARSAQLLNLADLGRDLGLALNTVKAWLSVLEATHQVIILRPYFANIGKRLVKTPKVYFADPGKDPEHAASGPLAGAIVETAVVIEVAKAYWHRGQEARLWFWRTATGEEVDVFVETAGGIVAVEAKATATPTLRRARRQKARVSSTSA
jgi:uncharacterized protein